MQSEWYDKIELTDDELKVAILEAKKKKFFHERSREHWEGQIKKAIENEALEKEHAKQRRQATTFSKKILQQIDK